MRDACGVTSAEATPITQNVLIQYNPQRTSFAALLEDVASAWKTARPLPVQPEPLSRPAELLHPIRIARHLDIDPEPAATPTRPAFVYVTGIRRTLYKIFGWASVGMAVVGAILPGIPTAPFVILAGYFFIRSSPSAHQWLRRSRWFGPILRDWEEHRGIRRSIRNAAVGLIAFSMVFINLLGLPLALVLTILATQIIGLIFVLSLRVVDSPSPAPALVAP